MYTNQGKRPIYEMIINNVIARALDTPSPDPGLPTLRTSMESSWVFRRARDWRGICTRLHLRHLEKA